MPTYTARPLSPADGTWVKDDFVSNDSVADAAVGEMRWEWAAIGNGATLTYLTQQPHGVLRSTTDGTADGDGSYLRTFTDGLVLEGFGGGIKTRVRIPAAAGNTLANNNFRIGVDDSVTITDPTVGIWISCAAGVLSVQADSADHGDATGSAAAVSTLTSGTTMVLDTWHTIEVNWTGANGNGGPRYVELIVDNEPAASIFSVIDNDEEVECKIVHWVAGTNDTLELDIDYFEFWQNRETPEVA